MSTDTLELVVENRDPAIDWDLKALYHPNAKYSAESKITVVTKYVLTGNLKQSAKDSGIDPNTAHQWKKEAAWWDDCIYKVRKQKQCDLDGVMTSAINIAMEEMTDRVKNGDVIRDTKTGELCRVPMKGKELAVAAAVIFDKRSLIRGDATAISRKADPLKDVEAKMMSWAKQVQNQQYKKNSNKG